MLKRVATIGAVLAALFLTSTADAASIAAASGKQKFDFHQIYMRSTSAASVAAETNWAKSVPGNSPSGFVDSLVFRNGATTANDADTTAAYHTSRFAWPPQLATGGGGGTTAVTDTTFAARLPWLAVRVRQEEQSYSFSGTSAMDSVYLAAQVSVDGVTWTTVGGTPTVAFETTNTAANPLIGPYAEAGASQDVATAYLDCVPSLRPINNGFIINRSMCLADMWVRFLVVGDYSGQFAVDLAYWSEE